MNQRFEKINGISNKKSNAKIPKFIAKNKDFFALKNIEKSKNNVKITKIAPISELNNCRLEKIKSKKIYKKQIITFLNPVKPDKTNKNKNENKNQT
jgi:hypothetical protein